MRIKIGGIKSDVVDDVLEVADFLIDGVDLGAAAVAGSGTCVGGDFLRFADKHINVVLLVSNNLGKVIDGNVKSTHVLASGVAS